MGLFNVLRNLLNREGIENIERDIRARHLFLPELYFRFFPN